MNEKEKMIEEMASDMNYGCVKHDLWPSDAKEIAKALYILGYRKITEPIKLTTIGYGKEYGCYYADIIATGQEFPQRIYFQASLFEKEEIQAETAKEFAERLKEKFDEKKHFLVAVSSVHKHIDETLKELLGK